MHSRAPTSDIYLIPGLIQRHSYIFLYELNIHPPAENEVKFIFYNKKYI